MPEITYDENGTALVEHHGGVNYPAELTFECVNDFVHESPHYEELQYLCLGLIGEIEKIRKTTLENIIDDMPENLVLVKDSGLWMLQTEDADEELLTQGVKESFADFVRRCIAKYKIDGFKT